ncbi:MAG: AI-2E family transporter [Candidatus Cloacimonas sp.]|jgi:predicted PurR-regulated permease PerM|nr:AI-2E family transporter [Candidatus Cloacimonas sp.]
MIEANKELRWIRILLIIITLPVVVIILKALKMIFIPLIFAIFLSFVFAPLTAFLKKRHIPLWLILLITLVIIACFFSLIVLIVYAASNSLITGLPRYQLRFEQLMVDGTTLFTDLAKRMAIATESIPLFDLNQLFSAGSVSIPKIIGNTMNTFMVIAWNFFLILVFMIFILLEADKLQARLKKVMSHSSKQQTLETLSSIQQQIQNYLTVKTLISLATALVGMMLMLAFGVDFVLVCGILLFVMNFIPNIGSVIASAIPIIIVVLQTGFDIRLVMFSSLIVATQMLFGNILEPRFQGNKLNLTPIMVLVSLIFWGWLWGFVGMLICVPLTSGINIILKQMDPDSLISALISGE